MQARRLWQAKSLATLSLLILAVASRYQFLGNPILDSDEGFYLLVGDRMLNGALPYVDIWDRKPIGLFLLYAVMRSLGGDGVLAYQLVGTAVAFATACLIATIARQFTSRFGAVAAAAAYLIWLTLGSAAGGQAELFYGLPVCIAASITLRGLQERTERPWLPGGVAMLLIGVAAQIKYNALFEGVFFGCCWLLVGWRSGRRAMLGAYAALWIGLAILPTVLAMIYYAAHGQLDAFMFANFASVFHRSTASARVLIMRLAGIAAITGPLLACVRPLHDPGSQRAAVAFRFTLCWLGAVLVSVLAFGTYLEQYLLPILIPGSAAAAAFFGAGRRAKVLLLLSAAFLAGQAKLEVTQLAHGSRAQLSEITRRVDPGRCLFVYSGLAALYRVSGTCIPTRFAFPSHLARAREAGAIGADPVQEVDRILQTRPGTVIVRSPYAGDENWAARRVLLLHLRRDYRRAYHGKLGWQWVDVYRLERGASAYGSRISKGPEPGPRRS